MENEPQKDEKGAIESLNERLNQPVQTTEREEITEFFEGEDDSDSEEVSIQSSWGMRAQDVLQKTGQSKIMKKKNTILKRFLWGAVIFFFISVIFASYVIIGGLNQVSSENIVITLEGSNNTPAGKVYDFSINLRNNNNVMLEGTTMTVEFPEGTRSSINPTLDFRRERFETGSIGSKKEIEKELSAILYGDKGEHKKIMVSFEYHVPGSNSAFTKTQEFEVEIDNSPIVVEVDMGKEFITGQEFETEIQISSNTDEAVRDVVLIAEYPFGFEFISSIPDTSSADSVWHLDTIDPTEKKTILLKGKVVGTSNDERTIRFNLGIRDTNDQNGIGSLITQKSHTYSIKQPLLEMLASVNGKDTDDLAFGMGQEISVSLDVRNNLETEAENVIVEIDMPQSIIIDDSTIRVANGGFYRSSDRKIVWDRNNNEDLKTVLPDSTIPLSFSFKTLSKGDRRTLSQRNPHFSIRGNVVGNADTKKVGSSIDKDIRINSDVNVAASAQYSGTSIVNTGPLPPVANTETTYTVTFSLSNSYNSLSGTKILALLPVYVDWKNIVTPSSENVSFNSNTREITWNVGRVQAGVGQSSSPEQVSFQIGLIPSTSQIGSSPVLIQNIRVQGQDDFTEMNLSGTTKSVNTDIKNDSVYFRGIELVVQ